MAAFQFPNPADGITTVVNPITGSTYQWKESPGKWVVTAKLTEASDLVWEGDSPPEPIGDYKLWYSTDTLELYFYYCDANDVCAWVPTSAPIQVIEDLNAFAAQAEVDIDQLQYKQQLLQNALDQIYLEQAAQNDKFVLKTGDTMTGVLEFDRPKYSDPDGPLFNCGSIDAFYGSYPSLNINTGGVLNVKATYQFQIEADNSGNGLGTAQYQFEYSGATFRVSDANRSPTATITVGKRNYWFAHNSGISIIGEGSPNYLGVDGSNAGKVLIWSSEGIDLNSRKVANIAEPTEESDATSKNYVDERDEEIRQDIIELEEELEALAPSLERGAWLFNPTGGAGVGQYGLFALGTSTNEYPQADALFINSVDSSGALHNFTDVEVGSYVEIFSPDDGDFGLYQVKVIHDETAGANSFWHFDVEHIRSNRPLSDAEGVCRFKFFNLSEGADPATFVLKRGDKMTGNLQISTEDEFGAASLKLSGYRDNNNNSAGTIAFENTHSGATGSDIGYITYYHHGDASTARFGFNRNIDLKSNDITKVSNLKLTNPGSIWSATNERIKFRTADNGNDGSGIVEFTRPGTNGRRGFTIRGKNTSNNDADILYTYTNSTGGDAIIYVGKQADNADHLATTKYVKNYIDNQLDFSKYQELS